MPAAPKIYSHFLKMLQPVESEFEDVKHLKGKLSVEKSLNSLGEFDHATMFEAIQEIYSYALACISSYSSDSTRQSPNACAGVLDGGKDQGGKGGGQGNDGGKGQYYDGKNANGNGKDKGKGKGKDKNNAKNALHHPHVPQGSWANDDFGSQQSSNYQNGPSRNVQNVPTKKIEDGVFPIWTPHSPECYFFINGNCWNGPECKCGTHVIHRENYTACLWCGSKEHVLKDCPHRMQKHPEWTNDFLRQVIKFPNQAGRNLGDVQYFSRSILADQLAGSTPSLSSRADSQAVAAQAVAARAIQIDASDFVELDALRAAQRSNEDQETSP